MSVSAFRRILSCLVLALTVFPAAAADPDWIDLFNGKDLTGWRQLGGEAKYRVEDGCIVGASVPTFANSFLCTDKDYADFLLQFDFKCAAAMNSGVQLRGLPPQNGINRVHGYQVEIDPSSRAWSAGIYDEGNRGWLYDLRLNTIAGAAYKKEDWNHVYVVCIGNTIKTWINSVPAAYLIDTRTPSGFIGLQVHNNRSATPLEVRWRNIKVLPLDIPDLPMVVIPDGDKELSPTSTPVPIRPSAPARTRGQGKSAPTKGAADAKSSSPSDAKSSAPAEAKSTTKSAAPSE